MPTGRSVSPAGGRGRQPLIGLALALVLVFGAVHGTPPAEAGQVETEPGITAGQVGPPARTGSRPVGRRVTELPGVVDLIAAPTASELAAAMDVPASDLVSASIGTSDPLGTEVWNKTLSFFPTRGGSFTTLSTGLASSADDPDTNNDETIGGGNPSDDTSYILDGLSTSQGHDLVQLTLALDVPPSFSCFLFDFAYFTEEMPDYLGSRFNDTFIAELGPPGGASTFTIEGSEVVAPNNVAFDPAGNAIDVNSAFGFNPAVPNPDTGTTYDGTSGLLAAGTEVTPGTQVEIVFSIMDLGDSIVDSAVFLDNFRWTTDPPGTCRPGAVPPAIDYFAVGDSVASGHGLMDGRPCRRSDLAYPHRVEEMLQERFRAVTFLTTACSGARAGDPTLTGRRHLAGQIDFVLSSLTERPTLVSVTIGGDDFGWTPAGGWRQFLDTWDMLTAAPRGEFAQWVRSEVRRIKRQLRKGVRRLLRHENVSVVITRYHNPSNTRSLLFRLPGGRCKEAPEFTSDERNTIPCYRRTEFVVHKLNQAHRGVRRALEGTFPGRVALAAVHKEFHGHESPGGRSRRLGWRCGTARPRVGSTWIQHPKDLESNSFPFANARKWFSNWLETVSRAGTWRGDCHHPNERGARAFAQAVNDAALAMGL